jgi:hypothetical protein
MQERCQLHIRRMQNGNLKVMADGKTVDGVSYIEIRQSNSESVTIIAIPNVLVHFDTEPLPASQLN